MWERILPHTDMQDRNGIVIEGLQCKPSMLIDK